MSHCYGILRTDEEESNDVQAFLPGDKDWRAGCTRKLTKDWERSLVIQASYVGLRPDFCDGTLWRPSTSQLDLSPLGNLDFVQLQLELQPLEHISPARPTNIPLDGRLHGYRSKKSNGRLRVKRRHLDVVSSEIASTRVNKECVCTTPVPPWLATNDDRCCEFRNCFDQSKQGVRMYYSSSTMQRTVTIPHADPFAKVYWCYMERRKVPAERGHVDSYPYLQKGYVDAVRKSPTDQPVSYGIEGALGYYPSKVD
ncbi:hypothetical protein T265_10683 [Opisthorchis viverrini]|uniref:Uncharacterized protein n=1 Tax=Opisthorchis viverrini TaxID=6198 RepID=A0A074Z5P7_OPIVI|nr:hypothetical protein T265_10683 [Opisthorchis viverrini]KER20857.1 hypothetical protein T265_10683 [Opisthorchis viverrini]